MQSQTSSSRGFNGWKMSVNFGQNTYIGLSTSFFYPKKKIN
jgi:hypothetical protein